MESSSLKRDDMFSMSVMHVPGLTGVFLSELCFDLWDRSLICLRVRCLIVRELKGLEKFIEISVVHPHMGALGE